MIYALRLTADEINGVEVNEKLTYAAAADDSGCLTIIDIKSRKIHKVCVRFLPLCCTWCNDVGLDAELGGKRGYLRHSGLFGTVYKSCCVDGECLS